MRICCCYRDLLVKSLRFFCPFLPRLVPFEAIVWVVSLGPIWYESWLPSGENCMIMISFEEIPACEGQTRRHCLYSVALSRS